ncbi:alpha/beta hydrolase [Streptomyces hundungensis]|uniref:alpha/beta hydrolase n=1 Tax=Streptomyces hundungensis TaxID=1077946 RepID=UPI0033D2DD49
MTTFLQRAALVTLSGAALAATLLNPAAEAASPATGPALAWHACAKAGGPLDQECADLSVPLDYGDPAGPHLTLAVSRVRSDRPEARRGTLAVIPGGPGGSGVQRLTQKGEALRKETKGAYDLVAFDPRGVGGSTRASCRLAPDDRRLVNLRPWPDAGGAIADNVARARRTAEECARNGGAVLRSFSTANEVRDLDLLRRALGERKLSAWGTSYGTYVGAQYAQKFPGRTDRFVLDSSGDPDPSRVERGWLANMAQGVDDRFPDFAAWAADPARGALRLAERADGVGPFFLDLAARLDRAPKESTTPGVPLTGNVLRQALQNALVEDAAFPQLARLIEEARDPAAVPVLPPALAGPLPDEDAAVMLGVLCNDVTWPSSMAAYQSAVSADRARHPLTAGMPVNVTPCSFWKDGPAHKPTRITDEGPSNVLMIQNLRDPAVPYSGALKMRAAFGDRARLVSVDHGGHGVYLANGNTCGDRAVTRFLTTGERPRRDLYCGA